VHRAGPPTTGPRALTARRAEAAADQLADLLDQQPDLAVAEAALRVHVETALAADNDARMARRFAAAHPDVPTVTVPALPQDVHDLAGLREIGRLLAG
jgi:hypothetical protein